MKWPDKIPVEEMDTFKNECVLAGYVASDPFETGDRLCQQFFEKNSLADQRGRVDVAYYKGKSAWLLIYRYPNWIRKGLGRTG